MSTNFEILVTIMKIILTKKVSYCSHYFSFGQHYFCNLTDRQAFFIMEASTDQKNFHVIMAKKLPREHPTCNRSPVPFEKDTSVATVQIMI